MEKDLSALRREYSEQELDVAKVKPCPFAQFDYWFGQAISSDLPEPNAMVLATVDANGSPSQRSVLLKYFDKSGFVFFTNFGSRKARQIAANSNVCCLFPWYELQRQVEVNGRAERVTITESMKYFAKRPRESQLGAWVSRQSEVVSSRSVLLNKLEAMKQKFLGGEVPLPDFWGGYRIVPHRIEFWQGGQGRLHDRIVYQRETGGEMASDKWKVERWSP